MADIQRKVGTPSELKLDGNGEGSFSAVFATLNVIDSDGDVTEKGAFGNQDVVISQWNHGSWGNGADGLPIGVGKIREDGNLAIVEGEFDLNDADALKTYQKLKYLDAKGRKVEWSYALPHTEHRFGQHEGQDVRFLEKIQVPEVSPVMLGAGVDTRLLTIKGAKMDEKAEKRAPRRSDSKRFVDQLDETVETVERVIARAEKVSVLAHEEDRQIGRRSLRRMKILRDALHEAVSTLDGLLDEKVQEDPNEELQKIAARYEENKDAT